MDESGIRRRSQLHLQAVHTLLMPPAEALALRCRPVRETPIYDQLRDEGIDAEVASARLPHPGVVALDDTAGWRIRRIQSRYAHYQGQPPIWLRTSTRSEKSGSATGRHAADDCCAGTASNLSSRNARPTNAGACRQQLPNSYRRI
jgi:hypothetical protein